MTKLTVTVTQPTEETYPVIIGEQLLPTLNTQYPLDAYSAIIIITDHNIAPHFLDMLRTSSKQKTVTCILPPGEETKTIDSVRKIWQTCVDENLDRKSLMINLGGGVIGDMGGFAASTYMRGIDFINIPTTILSQVDESVGGKTGIDFSGLKNVIGTFSQPKAVIIDIDTLKTLPERELNSGFAEIIKHGLIADLEYFKKVTAKKPSDFTNQELIEIITRSCEIKRDIVEQDTKEAGQRKKVNFGHTIGHALEALSHETQTPLLHGEAVSIGLVAEAKLSQLLGKIDMQTVTTIENALKQAHLPIRHHLADREAILKKTRQDKKNQSGKIKWTLLEEVGKAIFDQEVEEQLVNEVLDYITYE